MRDPSAEMQAAIHAKLVGYGALTTALGGAANIVDKVVGKPPPEMVRIGDDQAVGKANGCADAWEFFANIHIFSRDAGAPRMRCKLLANHVLGAIADLASPPTPTGFKIDELELVQSRTFPEADGLSFHGLVTVRYLVIET